MMAVGFTTAVAGFAAGCRYTARHLDEVLARASAAQLRELARRTAIRRTKTGG